MDKFFQFFRSENEAQTILCKECQKQIPKQSFTYHSQVCSQRNNSKKQMKEVKEVKEVKNKKRIFQSQKQKKMKEQIKAEDLQLIPCSFCGYKMTLDQLDTHPNSCEQLEPCEYCNEQYPNYLMDDHYNVCAEKIASQPDQEQEQEAEQEIDNNNPRVDVIQRLHLLIQLLNRLGEGENKGMTEQEISKLKIQKYIKNKEDGDFCTVCYCEIEETEEIINLPCKHMYHPECIKKWLEQNGSCPNCKKVVKEEN